MNLIVNGLITKLPVCTQDSHAGKSDQAGSVKMAGYRPGFLFEFLWSETWSGSVKNAKRERD